MDKKSNVGTARSRRIGWITFVIVSLLAESAWAKSAVRLEVRDNGRLVAPVGLDGKGSYRFLIDTGATTTVLSEKLALRIGLTLAGSARVHTFAGEVSAPIARVATITIGTRSVVGLTVLCADLGRMFGLQSGIDGILGQDVLGRFNYLLDFRSRVIEMEEDGDVGVTFSGTRLPFTGPGGKIYIPAADGALRLMLDSGIPYPVLYEDAISRVELTEAPPNKMTSAESGIGKRTLRPARLAALLLGDVRLTRLQVYLTERIGARRPEDGILSVHLFDAIYVNNSAGFLILNPRRDVARHQ